MTPERHWEGDTPRDVLRAAGVIPVVTIHQAALAAPLAEALVDGGLEAIEITLRTRVALEAIRAAAGVPGALVGAGTVTTASEAEAAIDAGARFVVSPGLVEEVLEVCARRGVSALPGIATPTEMLRARALGCRAVKVFPASALGGPSFVQALASLRTGLGFVPTGGISAATAPAYLAIPEVVAVGGSWMVPAAEVAANRWDLVTEAGRACRALREARP
jgi:2-dehydro-3-deoxyphosphogluconate aldolase/(4S)-4-hydroxy-2-oxoglutarate aldolase